ncbi:MAG: HesA/MoeB/ThiF family protein [Prevotella sp.]|nr:HesA/MoeB/ThiF family protein [Prevotella sp.]
MDFELKSRYARHLMLPEIGEEGQKKILSSRVLVVGAGGLGSPVMLYLAAAGVGTIGVIDADEVDLSNLQRQVIHQTKDLGIPKVESAREKMLAINPDVRVETYHEFLTPANALSIIGGYDFIVSCTDNLAAKALVSDTCVAAGKAFSHGGISEWTGQTFTYVPGTADYRAIFGPPPAEAQASPTSASAGSPDSVTSETAAPQAPVLGVLGAVAGMLGTIQAAETLKYLTGAGQLLTNRLLMFDALTMQFDVLTLGTD